MAVGGGAVWESGTWDSVVQCYTKAVVVVVAAAGRTETADADGTRVVPAEPVEPVGHGMPAVAADSTVELDSRQLDDRWP